MFLYIKNKKKTFTPSHLPPVMFRKACSYKKNKKEHNKRSYVLKIKKNLHPTPFTFSDIPKSLFLQKRIKKNVNKYSYILKIKKTFTPPHLPPDVPKSPFLQKRIKKNINNVLTLNIIKY
jgi:hypothetical protein